MEWQSQIFILVVSSRTALTYRNHSVSINYENKEYIFGRSGKFHLGGFPRGEKPIIENNVSRFDFDITEAFLRISQYKQDVYKEQHDFSIPALKLNKIFFNNEKV